MWKVIQNTTTKEKSVLHVGYDTPDGYVEIMTTPNQNIVEDEKKAIVAALGQVYNPAVPIVNNFVIRVDMIADMVYNTAVSSPAKLQEYMEAEVDAKAYMADKTARQPFVKAWAEATGWTDEQAAVDILKTAQLFKYALLQIRTYRLDAKEKIRRVPHDIDSMRVHLEDYTRKMMLLKGQLS